MPQLVSFSTWHGPDSISTHLVTFPAHILPTSASDVKCLAKASDVKGQARVNRFEHIKSQIILELQDWWSTGKGPREVEYNKNNTVGSREMALTRLRQVQVYVAWDSPTLDQGSMTRLTRMSERQLESLCESSLSGCWTGRVHFHVHLVIDWKEQEMPKRGFGKEQKTPEMIFAWETC